MAILNPQVASFGMDDVAADFRGSPKLQLLHGPMTLFRFAGSRTLRRATVRPSGPPPLPERGKWWFDSQLLATVVEDVIQAVFDGTREERRNVLAGVRTDLAIKQSWSNMAWFCRLDLAEADELWAWVGPAEQQRDKGAGFFEGMMPGGGTQYYVPGLDTTPGVRTSKEPVHALVARITESPSWRG